VGRSVVLSCSKQLSEYYFSQAEINSLVYQHNGLVKKHRGGGGKEIGGGSLVFEPLHW